MSYNSITNLELGVFLSTLHTHFQVGVRGSKTQILDFILLKCKVKAFEFLARAFASETIGGSKQDLLDLALILLDFCLVLNVGDLFMETLVAVAWGVTRAEEEPLLPGDVEL